MGSGVTGVPFVCIAPPRRAPWWRVSGPSGRVAESGKWVWELMQSVSEYFQALTLHPVLRAGDAVAPLSPVFTVTELTLQGDEGARMGVIPLPRSHRELGEGGRAALTVRFPSPAVREGRADTQRGHRERRLGLRGGAGGQLSRRGRRAGLRGKPPADLCPRCPH